MGSRPAVGSSKSNKGLEFVKEKITVLAIHDN